MWRSVELAPLITAPHDRARLHQGQEPRASAARSPAASGRRGPMSPCLPKSSAMRAITAASMRRSGDICRKPLDDLAVDLVRHATQPPQPFTHACMLGSRRQSNGMCRRAHFVRHTTRTVSVQRQTVGREGSVLRIKTAVCCASGLEISILSGSTRSRLASWLFGPELALSRLSECLLMGRPTNPARMQPANTAQNTMFDRIRYSEEVSSDY